MLKDNNVSVSVPYNYTALINASIMLKGIAESMPEAKTVLTDADALADLNREPRPDNPTPEATVMQVENPAAVTPPPPAAPVTPAPKMITIVANAAAEINPVPVTPPNAPSELDANGLPWDERIHAKTKTKDVKGIWKYLRGVDKAVLVPQVEAELKALVGEPVVEEAAVTPPPPAAEVTPSVNVTTFAQLVTAITANSIDETRVKEALDKVRIGNFALLGARPDLIPAVAGHLGL